MAAELRRLVERARRLEAAPEAAGRARAVTPFADWLGAVSPTYHWHWPHLALIRTHLAAVTEGRIDRLAVFCPPRHGKSEQTTVRYPAWRLERDPHTRVVIAAYNQQIAEKFSRKARKVARGRVEISRERDSARQWETPEGGGVRACGVGSPPTGEGADLLVIDDPVKSREEANSAVYREKVWDWYADDLLTRLEPGGAVVLIQTRWHTDDLAGRILNGPDAARWTVVSLPALAEEDDQLGRRPGQALCPERYDERALAARQQEMLAYSFSALYQQRPVPREGGLFTLAGLSHFVDARPAEVAQRVRSWDKGYSAEGDWTVGVLMSKTKEGLFVIEDVERFRLGPAQRNERIKAVARADDAIAPGRRVLQLIEQPPGAGTETTRDLVRELAGHNAQAVRPVGDKSERAEPLAAQVGAGNVRLVKAAWNRAFVDELTLFPSSTNDDQVDAASTAFLALTNRLPLQLRVL